MSFRLKVGLSFCCILFLMIAVAVASWWGMNSAVQRQNTIFAFSLEIDRKFNSMAQQEHSFSTTKEISYAHGVSKTLEELSFSIGEMIKKACRSQQEQVDKVLEKLEDYRRDFSYFTEQVVKMETMQSRMTNESDRLRSNTVMLTDQKNSISQKILLQTSRMLQAEKTFMLTGTKISAKTVTMVAVDIEILAAGFKKYGFSAAVNKAYVLKKLS